MIPLPTIKKASSPLSKTSKKKSNNNNKMNNNWSVTNYLTPIDLTADAHDIDINDNNYDSIINRYEVQDDEESYSSSFTTPAKNKNKMPSSTLNEIKTEHDRSNVITPPFPKLSSLSSSSTTSKLKNNSDNQSHLDFGKSVFDRHVTCSMCNMVHVEGLIDDESNHSKLCMEYSLGVS